ncbi:hypothetical protein [Acidipila rosea]|nr:hypothetical protein [Acidipila rosea]
MADFRGEAMSWRIFLLATFSLAASALAQTSQIPADVPLRVELDHSYKLKPGTPVTGHLIAPVYLVDHEVLPVNTKVSGMITGRHPVKRSVRTEALLDGDFTPLKEADVTFNRLTLPNGAETEIHTVVKHRDAGVVKMGGTKKRSLRQQAMDQLRQRREEALDVIRKPGKGDRLRRFLYAQMPYHPQDVWAGTEYDAKLTEPVDLPPTDSQPMPQAPPGTKPPVGLIEARLVEHLNSATSKKGEPAEAILTAPLLTADKKEVILPEGTKLEGSVVVARPARSFSRTGQLRFTFKKLVLPEGTKAREIHGQLAAAEAAPGSAVTIDQEGGAKAGQKNKLLAPLTLGLMAMASTDGDGGLTQQGVTSNGFGIVARILAVTVADHNMTMGFAFYALGKSVTQRWIMKGHEVDFPTDTRLAIQLNPR